MISTIKLNLLIHNFLINKLKYDCLFQLIFFFEMKVWFTQNPMDSCLQNKHLCLCKQFQSSIFSSNCDLQYVKEKIEEVKSFLSPSEIDHQLILAFSLSYNKIPLFQPILSKSSFKVKDFIHFDQEFLFHLIQSNISFPL